jgi:uncharacterized protein YjbJ (UPF0337 family)
MSIWDRARAKIEQLYGRAEELYGETHGDAAAEVRGEAHLIDADVDEGDQAAAAAEEQRLGNGPAAAQLDGTDDDVAGPR